MGPFTKEEPGKRLLAVADVSVYIELTPTPWKKHHLVLYLGPGKKIRIPITRNMTERLKKAGLPWEAE